MNTINENRDQNKPESSPRLTAQQIEKKLKRHFTVVPVGTPNEGQLRLVSLYTWMIEQARNPERVSIFVALEIISQGFGYDPFLYRKQAQALFDLLDEEN